MRCRRRGANFSGRKLGIVCPPLLLIYRGKVVAHQRSAEAGIRVRSSSRWSLCWTPMAAWAADTPQPLKSEIFHSFCIFQKNSDFSISSFCRKWSFRGRNGAKPGGDLKESFERPAMNGAHRVRGPEPAQGRDRRASWLVLSPAVPPPSPVWRLPGRSGRAIRPLPEWHRDALTPPRMRGRNTVSI